MHSHLRDLEDLARDLSRVEQGGKPGGNNSPQSTVRSINSYSEIDMESPNQLNAYLTRGGTREVLRILHGLSPPRGVTMPAVIESFSDESIEPAEKTSFRLLSFPLQQQQQQQHPQQYQPQQPPQQPQQPQQPQHQQHQQQPYEQQVHQQPEILSLPRLPKISAVTKSERKRIGRLPKANKYDLKVLGQLNEQFIENNQLDVDKSLYKKLKSSRKIGESNVMNFNDVDSRINSSQQSRRHSNETSVSNHEEPSEIENKNESDMGTEDNEDTFFDELNNNSNNNNNNSAQQRSPVAHFQKQLEGSFEIRRQITNVIDDQMRRDRLDLPLSFIKKIENKKTRAMFLKERATVAILFMLRRVLGRRKAQYLKRWRDFNMYYERNRILQAVIHIHRVARGKLGRMEAAERRIQQAIQMEAEKERQTELAQLRWNASIDMQRLMRGWYARGFADLAKMHRDGATCIQCFIRYTFANRLVKQVRETKRINFESSSTIQRSYRCYKARILFGLKRRIYRAEKGVEYAKQKTEDIRLKFEAKGAANLISRWWRMTRVRMQFLRYRKLNKGRRTLKIQCSYRCYAARVELTRRKKERTDWLVSRDRAASLVQALYRRKQQIRRVNEMRAVIAAADGERRARIEEAKIDRVKTFKFVGEVNLTKVHRQLFNFRKAVDPFKTSHETKAVIKLQAYYRGNKSRKRMRQQKMDHHLHCRREKKLAREAATLRIQTRWRSKILRRQFLALKAKEASTTIQKTWRAYKGRLLAMSFLQYTFSARNIQRVWRGYSGRDYAQKKKIERNLLGIKATGFQLIARQFLARQQVERMKERLRYLEEVGLMGKEEFRVCRAHLRDELMLTSFKTRGGTGTGIGHIFFEALCSGGRKSVLEDKKELRIGNTVLSRMCNDSHIIDDRRVKRNTIGILFAKSKAKNNDKLNFKEFHIFLRSLAKTRYPKINELRQTKFADAQLLTMLSDHLLGGDDPKLHRRQLRTKLFRKMAKELDKITDLQIGKLATRMQAAIRGVQCRHRFVKLMMDHDKLEERQRLERASQLVQAHIRKVFARAGAEKLASKTIQKFVDPVSKEAYYYNPKTGVTSWDKPVILGKNDVLDPQVLPDKNIEFVVMCANCDRAVAESFCFPCGDGYCVDCFQSLHRKGKKKEHPETSIPRCHVCLYQAASRRLVGANKTKRTSIHAKKPKNAPKTQFCDSCYGHKHVTDLREAEEKGKQPPPTAEWVVQRCCECEERKIKNVLLFLCIFFFIFCLKFNLFEKR